MHRVGSACSAGPWKSPPGSNLPSQRRTCLLDGDSLFFNSRPAPTFRVEKEIKNVVVALAKSSHYWDGHLTAAQQSLAAEGVWEAATPSEAAANPSEYEAAVREVENSLLAARLPTSPRRYVGWVGVETGSEEDAVWLLRAVLVEQVLARREGKVLYLPVGATPSSDQAAHAGQAFRRAWDLRTASSPRRPAWRP